MTDVGTSTELSLTSEAFACRDWKILELEGCEALSRPFEFDLTIACDKVPADLAAILRRPVSLRIARGPIVRFFHGIFGSVDLVTAPDHCGASVLLRVKLVPALYGLQLFRRSRIFRDRSARALVAALLAEHGLAGPALEDRCLSDSASLEFVMQYQESDLELVSRLLEHYGIFYFWEQSETEARLILGDSLRALPPGHAPAATQAPSLPFVPPNGMASGGAPSVQRFGSHLEITSARVVVRDYNYRFPGVRVEGEAAVPGSAAGTAKSGYADRYGEHVKDEREAAHIARVRAEEIECRARRFLGESDALVLGAGAVFSLEHPYKELSGRYRILEVSHEARPGPMAWAGSTSSAEAAPNYANRFVALAADRPFRPPLLTPKPRIYGVMHAHVDGAGKGKYAEIDAQGRYRVRLPLDTADSPAGGASRWVRMAQPYAGAHYGLHFPLHPGAEVLLTFLDGDCDRPIISGAVPNAVTPSPVAAESCKQSILRTAGGNALRFCDDEGSEFVEQSTPHGDSCISQGASHARAPVPGICATTEKSTFWASRACMGIYSGGPLREVIGQAVYRYSKGAQVILAGFLLPKVKDCIQIDIATMKGHEQALVGLAGAAFQSALLLVRRMFVRNGGILSATNALDVASAPPGITMVAEGGVSAISSLGETVIGSCMQGTTVFGRGGVDVAGRRQVRVRSNKHVELAVASANGMETKSKIELKGECISIVSDKAKVHISPSGRAVIQCPQLVVNDNLVVDE